MIYTNCMQSEMAKGTSIRHKTPGMDPQRMLMEEEAEAAIVTRELLQRHVASRVYNITIREWQYGAMKVSSERLTAARIARKKREKRIKGILWNLLRMFTQTAVMILISVVLVSFAIYGRILKRYRRWRGIEEIEMPSHPDAPAPRRAPDGDVIDKTAKGGQKVAKALKDWVNKIFSDDAPWKAASEAMDAVGDLDDEPKVGAEKKVEKLDTTYMDDDELEETGAAGGAAAGGDSGTLIKDNLQSTLTIDVYMQYRAMPLCTHIERTAPWRAFQLQVIEILVFFINSSGAVLVGVDEDGTLTSYVAITVAIAAVLNSYLEFSRLAKQVEAYNTAQRDLHNLFNDWDSMTRTERRTRATIAKVVGTVEIAQILIAISLTDAIPSGQQGGGGGGDADGDGEDDKE
jgi:hypothetical protein